MPPGLISVVAVVAAVDVHAALLLQRHYPRMAKSDVLFDSPPSNQLGGKLQQLVLSLILLLRDFVVSFSVQPPRKRCVFYRIFSRTDMRG